MDETQHLVDSVMGNLKALLQEMSTSAQLLEKEWKQRSLDLQSRYSGYGRQFEPTEQEERREREEQRACDELYDRAKIIRECMNLVAQKVNNIIGENITIQFSKWNM